MLSINANPAIRGWFASYTLQRSRDEEYSRHVGDVNYEKRMRSLEIPGSKIVVDLRRRLLRRVDRRRFYRSVSTRRQVRAI